MFKFSAIVSSRSTKAAASGPPGEKEILRLNPQRGATIRHATGWSQLVEGTLNLEVPRGVVSQLSSCTHLIFESPSQVTYPPPYQWIPEMRGGYFYYRATIEHQNKTAQALIRRAKTNPILTRVEAFSDRCLRDVLEVSDDDTVLCNIHDAASQ